MICSGLKTSGHPSFSSQQIATMGLSLILSSALNPEFIGGYFAQFYCVNFKTNPKLWFCLFQDFSKCLVDVRFLKFLPGSLHLPFDDVCLR
jgi:hypothetical protein